MEEAIRIMWYVICCAIGAFLGNYIYDKIYINKMKKTIEIFIHDKENQEK